MQHLLFRKVNSYQPNSFTAEGLYLRDMKFSKILTLISFIFKARILHNKY